RDESNGGEASQAAGPEVVVGDDEQAILQDVPEDEGRAPGSGGAAVVPGDSGLVARLPAEPAHPPVQVDVLDVREEAFVERAAAAFDDILEHPDSVERGGAGDAEDLSCLVPLAQVELFLPPVHGPAVSEEHV